MKQLPIWLYVWGHASRWTWVIGDFVSMLFPYNIWPLCASYNLGATLPATILLIPPCLCPSSLSLCIELKHQMDTGWWKLRAHRPHSSSINPDTCYRKSIIESHYLVLHVSQREIVKHKKPPARFWRWVPPGWETDFSSSDKLTVGTKYIVHTHNDVITCNRLPHYGPFEMGINFCLWITIIHGLFCEDFCCCCGNE